MSHRFSPACELVAGSASTLIGHINKRRGSLPSTAAVPTDQSVPAAGEVVVIACRRTGHCDEGWWGGQFFTRSTVAPNLTC